MHELSFLHGDLKLDNILVGHHDSNRLYLIDFGLSERYKDESGSHLPKVKKRTFSGNLMFASLSQLRGNTQSRRDDIESALYLLTYLTNK